MTQTILDSGSVLVYAKISNNIHQLNFADIDLNFRNTYTLTIGNIEVDTAVYNADPGNPPPPPPTDGVPTQLRYVIISGPTAMAMQAKHINPANYNEVSQYLNLGN